MFLYNFKIPRSCCSSSAEDTGINIPKNKLSQKDANKRENTEITRKNEKQKGDFIETVLLQVEEMPTQTEEK